MHEPALLVAPTEPPELRRLGTTSPIPEHHGCDVVWTGHEGLVGVQRKELTDLWSSLRDGRLAREMSLMRLLVVRVLIIEGRVRWSARGQLSTARAPLSRDQLRGLLLSAQRRGVWVLHTDDVGDTADALLHLWAWMSKRVHVSMSARPAAVAEPGSRSWGVHLLQSFPSIGPTTAGGIYDHFGRVPLGWTAGPSELAAVRGVGPVRAASLWASLPTEAVAVPLDGEGAAGAAA